MTPDQDLPTNPGENPTTPASPGSGPRSGTGASTAREPLPERIGGYRVVRELGRGGMGVVYLARKDDDRFQRTVAIKVVKRGMDTEDIVRRFETERQLLAAMDHPNIARLLDGGTTEDGRPYFVVEHIEGKPIDKYCDENRLSVGERLRLFLKVCSAVHYAHQNLVVHRDIKPGNILVTKEGEPKLLDFGIAKLLNPAFAPVAQDPTSPSLRLMTPEYASPEQVRGEMVGTASDVYSLGVLLFELLTGHRPYRLKTRLQSEIERIICEVEPEKPSTAVSKVEEIASVTGSTSITPASVALTREKRPDRLRRRLEGDVDNIVLMALRKEPRRRYQSAMQFAEDIRNHLEGRPVIARRPTPIYRAAKFARRNRYGVAAAAAVFLALLLGVIGTSIGMQRAVAAEKAAVAQRDRAERLFAEGRALANAFITEFMDAVKQLPGSVAAQELIVQKGLAYLEGASAEAGDDPAFVAELQRGYLRIGGIQSALQGSGRMDRRAAEATFLRARDIVDEARARLRTPDPRLTAGAGLARLQLSQVYEAVKEPLNARRNLEEAIPLLREASQQGVDVQRPLRLAELQHGDLLMDAGDVEAAARSFEQSLTAREQVVAGERTQTSLRDLSTIHNRLGDVEMRRGRHTQAVERYRAARDLRVEIERMEPSGEPTARSIRDIAISRWLLARALQRTGDLEAAERELRAAHGAIRQLTEADPNDRRVEMDLVNISNTLQQLLTAQGRHDEAEAALLPALVATERAILTRTDDAALQERLADLLAEYGHLRTLTGDPRAALASVDRALVIIERRRAESPTSASLRLTYAGMQRIRANALIALERWDEAERSLTLALDAANAPDVRADATALIAEIEASLRDVAARRRP